MTLESPLTLVDAARAVRAGEMSPLDFTRAALERARDAEHLNLFAALDADGALEQAEALTREARAGRFRGPLHGVPVTVKDLFNVAGLPTRAGTRAALPDLGAAEAAAVARLRDAGAVILGKVNMHEVALGVTGENAWTGDVLNPHDPARQAGGSSSGSAAAVAAGVGFASLGTDTGGSIRIPAALCGVVGFKPTHGLVPLDGALALSPTCDHAGPFARTVRDALVTAEVLAGREFRLRSAFAAPRIGVPREYLEGRLGAGVRAAFEAFLAAVAAAGAMVVDVRVEDLPLAARSYTPLVRAEAACVHRAALEAGGAGFSDSVRESLMAGLALRAVDYLEARAERRRVRAGVDAALASVDALLLPGAPVPAPVRGSSEVVLESGVVPHRAAFLALTQAFSLVGVPVLSVPFAVVEGLPVGVQVVTARGEDARAFEVGAWLMEVVR